MLSNSHSHYSAPRKTIYPITANFRKEIFLNPKSSLGLVQPSKTLEPDSRQSPNESFTNDSVQKPRVLEAHASKQFSSGSFQAIPVNQTNDLQKDFHVDRGMNGIRIPHGSESSTINKIPFSPIGFKQMKTNLISLNSDQKSDHLSTEPSVADSSNHHTPPQYGNGMSYKKDRTTIFGSDLKPPCLSRALRGPQLSIGSLGDIEKRDSFRTPKARFSSDSKNFRSNIFTELPGDGLGIRPNPSTINSNVSTSTILGFKTGPQGLYHSETMDRHTPPKITQNSSLDMNSNVFLSQLGNNSNKSSNSQDKFRTNNTARSSQEGKKSSTSDELKKYITNLNQKFENFEAGTWIKQVLGPNPRKDLKCNCDANLEVDKTCSRALRWISKKYKPEEFDYLKNTYEKIISEQKLAEPDQIKQIQKDVHRTYPESKLFAVGSEGIKTLERVLNAVAKFDPSVGYVQGMNFIAGSLLFHAEEYIAFWILVSIFELLEMRDIFLPMLPGLSKHCQIIDMLILNVKPTVYSKLCQFQIRPEMYCSEWILTLFSSVVPITDMKRIFDNLFTQGWTFFYGLVLAFLDHFEKQLIAEEDLIGVLTILKSQNRMSSNQSKSPYYINWKDLCRKAHEFNIDPEFVSQMHLNFDNKNLWFRTTS